MDSLVMENLLYNKKPVSMFLDSSALSLKIGDGTITVDKNNIRNLELFRGLKGFCLRVAFTDKNGATSFYDIYNIHDSYLVKLKSIVSSLYGFTLPVQDLEYLLTTEGNLVFSNDMLSLQSDKQIFGIPKSAIKKVMELDNDLHLDLGDTEIALNTTSSVANLLTDKQAEEVCIINAVNCINPRSKSTLVFFNEHFVLKGSSYDHIILYESITEMFFLKYEHSFYLVIKLDSCVIQGQTKYESLVFLLNDKEVEVVASHSRLKEHYCGEQSDVVLEIFEGLTKMKAQESELYVKCTSKVYDGYLYFLNHTLLFLPKSFSISLDDISTVEFSRINLSIVQAKTFDMTIVGSKVYNFNGIQKDAFNKIELYFNQKNIKMVSEVVEESFSEDSSFSDNESDDLSDIIGSDE